MANLLLQLYHAELPGALRGPLAGQQALMQHILRWSRGALFRQYIVVDTQDVVLATAGLRLSGDRVAGDMPQGTVRLAFRTIGFANTLRLFSILLRRSITPDESLRPQSAFLHSVVVDQRFRGQGVGAWLVDHVERVAARDGARSIQLRVIVGNEHAKRLYQRLGYRVVGRTPAVLDWIAIPTELMCKTIPPAS